jgi:hypothetical protein
MSIVSLNVANHYSVVGFLFFAICLYRFIPKIVFDLVTSYKTGTMVRLLKRHHILPSITVG